MKRVPVRVGKTNWKVPGNVVHNKIDGPVAHQVQANTPWVILIPNQMCNHSNNLCGFLCSKQTSGNELQHGEQAGVEESDIQKKGFPEFSN